MQRQVLAAGIGEIHPFEANTRLQHLRRRQRRRRVHHLRFEVQKVE